MQQYFFVCFIDDSGENKQEYTTSFTGKLVFYTSVLMKTSQYMKFEQLQNDLAYGFTLTDEYLLIPCSILA